MLVYLLHADSTSRYKIGFTAGKLAARIKALQTGCPYPINPVAAFHGTETDQKRLHLMYENYRVIGEWFEFVADILPSVMFQFTAKRPMDDHLQWERDHQMTPARLGHELWHAIFNESARRKYGEASRTPKFRGTPDQMSIHQDWIDLALSHSTNGKLNDLSPDELHAMYPLLDTVRNYD